jgi:hypothetical protein
MKEKKKRVQSHRPAKCVLLCCCTDEWQKRVWMSRQSKQGEQGVKLSVLQGHGVKAFNGVDHVRPFPNKNQLEGVESDQPS